MDPPPPKRPIPASFGKYFKTTIKAQKLMDREGRICELDRKCHDRELVFSNHPSHGLGWDEMRWSQALLWDTAQKDPSIRIARKSSHSVQPGDTFTLIEDDMLNFSKGNGYGTAIVAEVKLGYAQCRREWVYLISKKMSQVDMLAELYRGDDSTEGVGGSREEK